MTVLLIILGIIILIIIALLFLPVTVHISFKEEFFFKVCFSGITVFESGDEKEEKMETDKNAPSRNAKEKDDNKVSAELKGFWSFLKEKYGFKDAVKTVLGFVGELLSHIKRLLRHIKIKKVRLNIIVASGDAAKTAVDYGEVCAAAYPITAFLNSCAEIGFKEINVSTDFTSDKSDFDFSAVIRLQVFFLLLAALRCYNQYKKFILKENYNEREQH